MGGVGIGGRRREQRGSHADWIRARRRVRCCAIMALAAPRPAAELFDLRETHNPHRWVLPVETRICVGPPENTFLFGGVGLAASIAAMERTTGRPAIWATAQYLAYAKPGEFLDVDVIVPKQGKHVTQARVVGHVGDREILTVNAALGARPQAIAAQWARMPEVPPPSSCEPMPHFDQESDDLHQQF